MNKVNILLIQNDINLAKSIKNYLEVEERNVDISNSGTKAMSLFDKNQYLLIILDLLLQDISGFKVCRYIREKSTIPIIILTSLNDKVCKLQSLCLGADDYITKPFDLEEFIARIKSLLRRTYIFSKKILNEDYERFAGKLKLNKKNYSGYYEDFIIKLTPKEFKILWLLMEDPNKVYSMDEIHQRIWGDSILEREVNPVMSHIRRIRYKFEKLGLESPIETVWGFGYKIKI